MNNNGQVAETLQPLTESDVKKGLAEYDEPKVLSDLIDLMRKLKADPKMLEPSELQFLERIINQVLSKLPLQELTDFAYGEAFNDPAFNMISREDLRRQVWEQNHAEISRCLHNFLVEHRRPPTRNELAQETKLSRQTITKHLQQFTEAESYKHERKAFKMLSNRVLQRVYESALEGNTRAARLYLEMCGELGSKNSKNYFIQINNLKVNNELIASLPKEKRIEIENIILSTKQLQSGKPS